jgi:phosphoribosylaminoimidazole-succinocarboxamide synthase
MTRRRRIYEGKAKILYEGPEPGTIVVHFKDDATAFNAQKKAVIEGKGVLNNRISEFIFTQLNDLGLPTHFIKRLNMREQLVREVEIIPLEVIVRNVAAGSMAQRLGLEEGSPLPRSIIEFCYKNDELGDPLVAEEHVTAFGWASPQEIDDIMAMTIRINDFMSGMFAAIGIKLVDFKIELRPAVRRRHGAHRAGRRDQPGLCRLWDMKTNEKLDKDRFRRDLGGLVEAYQEVARRLGISTRTTRHESRCHSAPRPQPRPRHDRRTHQDFRPGPANRLADRDSIDDDVDLIVIPGGFSYGDYLRCGAIAARMPVMKAVRREGRKGRARDRRVQRLPDPARGRPAARCADAQRLAQIRLPRSDARKVTNAKTAFTRGYAGPAHPLPGRPS